MDFATFTTETLNYLWRAGDTDLQASLPKIVRTAEARLRTDLKLRDADVSETVMVSDNPFTKPTAADVIHSIGWPDKGPGVFVPRTEFDRAHDTVPLVPGSIRQKGRLVNMLEFTVDGDRIYHRRDINTPAECIVTYTPLPASLVNDDDTLFNAYTDVYELAVYTEALMYLLEEQRAAMMEARYQSRLTAARFDQSERKYAGSPLKMSMPRRDVS